MKLRIADNLVLPIDAVTQTLAAIGRKGAGKTYLATMIAEQMLDAQAQVIVLDAVGNWYGLRIGADGKSKGKDIFVAGGEHGDVPLVPEAGAKIARLLVEKRISMVLDISGFRIGERKRFATDFAEEFFHLKKSQRSPVHVFIEEAQLFVPQRFSTDEARMYGAFEAIVRIGRNYGIGCTLISQRPQSVNKEVLSQVECLCVLQVNGTHERKALEDWVQEAGADRKLVGELPGMSQGEGYVWSPSWLRIFQRVNFAKKTTFDASATPEVGKSVRAATLSAVDVESLRESMQEVIAEAEKDDPKALRRQIAELEKRLKHQAANFASETKVETVEVKVVPSEQIESLQVASGDWNAAHDSLHSLAAQALKICESLKTALLDAQRVNQSAQGKFSESKNRTKGVHVVVPPQVLDKRKIAMPGFLERKPAAQSNGDLSGPERRILNSIAWLNSIGVSQPEQPAVAFLAGYTVDGGAFNNPRGRLNQRGFVRYVQGGKIELTDDGQRHAEEPDTPLDAQELQRMVLQRLPGPEQRILQVLIEAYPDALSNEACAKAAGYAPDGGAYNNPRGRLRSLGLIEYPERGVVQAKPLLFLS